MIIATATRNFSDTIPDLILTEEEEEEEEDEDPLYLNTAARLPTPHTLK